MRIRLTGRIVDTEPRLPSRIAGKRLIFDGKGPEHMILDSGVTGSIAISEEWANRLDSRYAGIQPFELANGQIVEFPTYLGFVRFGRVEALFEFIVKGETLLGMEFFERLRARIVVDCRDGKVRVDGECHSINLRSPSCVNAKQLCCGVANQRSEVEGKQLNA